MPTLRLIHFNDVYRVQPQKITPNSKETIDVTQFSALLHEVRSSWPAPDAGLVLFSGDVFSPSVESSVTRGSHMVPVMNQIAPDVSLTGNHDFDFGYPHLVKLVKDSKFPWILSNIVDNTTGKVPEGLLEFVTFERAGVRIGVIGLVEKEWIGTVSAWPSEFEYRDMKQTGLELSKRLRDPAGEYKCDLIIALTHARVPNDVALAKDLLAYSPSHQKQNPVASEHGADILLGGHDHLYYASKGCTWEGYDVNQEVLGAEQDQGDVLVIKSGTDFRDLSEIDLDLEPTPDGSVRRMVIKSIQGKRRSTEPGSKSDTELRGILDKLLSSVSDTLKKPVCISSVPLDVRSQNIRVSESAAGNWFADVLRHAYDDCLCVEGGGSDAVFICAGTLRGDSMYGPGHITLGDILEILPFEDPIVVLELDGQAIWDSLEASLETWPAQEGRFPTISGMRVSWDSSRPAGSRVLGVWLTAEQEDSVSMHGSSTSVSEVPTPRVMDSTPIERTKGGRKYKIVTREYMAQGHDGFEAMKGAKYLVDDEVGQLMSSLVRKYLLGSHFVNVMARAALHEQQEQLKSKTWEAIARERHHRERHHKHYSIGGLERWRSAVETITRHRRSKSHIVDSYTVSGAEHMSGVDIFDGHGARNVGNEDKEMSERARQVEDEDLLTINPAVDGRLKDVAR
ncbi:Metallo-dependent phosphatase, partial [Cylindrobasidium torrendii FP15055 ss-10]